MPRKPGCICAGSISFSVDSYRSESELPTALKITATYGGSASTRPSLGGRVVTQVSRHDGAVLWDVVFPGPNGHECEPGDPGRPTGR